MLQLMVEAVCGDGMEGDIAVDDISMVARKCSEATNGNYLICYNILIATKIVASHSI